MTLGTEVGLDPGDIVLDGYPAAPPPQRKGHSSHPQFSAHVYCGQKAGWIKMPFDTEVGLGPGNIVLDGNPVPPLKSQLPNFWPMTVVIRRMDGSRCHLVRR